VPDNKAAARKAAVNRAASKDSRPKAVKSREAKRAACPAGNKTKEEANREGIPNTSSKKFRKESRPH